MLMKRRRAVTLTELLVGVIVLAVLAGAFTLSPKLGRQTTKREAEKLMSRLYNMTQKANRIHMNFKMQVKDESINFIWQKKNSSLEEGKDIPYKVSKGLKLYPKFSGSSNELTYNASENDFNHQGGHIIIKRGEKDKCAVVFAVSGGRMRISQDVRD